MAGELNTVPLGEAGTGAAFILPDSKAINNIGDYIDSQAAQRAAAEKLKQQQAQQLAAAWKENQINIKGGTLWQPEINKAANDAMQAGFELQGAGINPNQYYNDPAIQSKIQNYQSLRSQALQMADSRDEFQKQAAANEKMIGEQVPGYYDNDSINSIHNFIGNTKLSDIMANGYQMPQLKRAFDLNAKLEKVKGVSISTKGVDQNGVEQELTLPNRQANAENAARLINTDPEVQADVAKKAGMPYADIGTETSPTILQKQVDDYYKSPENMPELVSKGIKTYTDPNYGKFVQAEAAKRANAAQIKADYQNTIANKLNDDVNQKNYKDWNFKYQQEQDRRERLGMKRQEFAAWAEDQQNEAGSLSVGNAQSYVPVKKQFVYPEYHPGSAPAVNEKGASLYTVNLPKVSVMVRPSEISNTDNGEVRKNSSPIDVDVSQIQMVPVITGAGKNNPLKNGTEISARQYQEVMNGKHSWIKPENITFKPYVYGMEHKKAENGVHIYDTPVRFSYDALRGSNVKKINTAQFDNMNNMYQKYLQDPAIQSLSPQQKMQFFAKKFNLNFTNDNN